MTDGPASNTKLARGEDSDATSRYGASSNRSSEHVGLVNGSRLCCVRRIWQKSVRELWEKRSRLRGLGHLSIKEPEEYAAGCLLDEAIQKRGMRQRSQKARVLLKPGLR